MNQCSPSQFILSEKLVHVTHTLTRLTPQKTCLPWCSTPRNVAPHCPREKREGKPAPDELLRHRERCSV
jgi:hypothetical protein